MRNRFIMMWLFGLGMLATAQAWAGLILPGDPIPMEQLVLNKAVQTDLKINDQQGAKLQEWSKGLEKKAQEIIESKGLKVTEKGVKIGLTTDQGDKFFSALAEIEKMNRKDLSEILKKEQFDRLKQILLQDKGLWAFENRDVAQALKLTDSQKTTLKKLKSDILVDQRVVFGQVRGTLQELRLLIRKIQSDYVEMMLKDFSTEQKKTWNALIGEPFNWAVME